MQARTKLVLGALAALSVLAVAVATASASKLEVPVQAFRSVWGAEKTHIEPAAVNCELTLEGSFHSRTFTKTSGSLVGYITRAAFAAGCGATVKTESLPWHLRYQGFNGTLPHIREVIFQVIGLRIETGGGAACVYTSTTASPARLIANITGGKVTTTSWESGSSIPKSGGEAGCRASQRFERAGTPTALNREEPILIKLITGSSDLLCPKSIAGEGSSLQRLAQAVWAPLFAAGCAGPGTVSYNPSGSGAGLSAWHAEGRAGSITESGDHFIATDDAPESGELTNIREHARSAGVAVIPVVQAAVAVIVHRPAGCEITRIDNESLEKVWDHEVTNWERISPRPTGGAACNAVIRRVVRKDKSGTTYQFKHYLYLINKLRMIGGKTWEGLQESAENVNWPERATDLVIPAATGGGALVNEVEATANSIGYANLSDALGHANVTLIEVQNGTEAEGGKTYARAQEGEAAANCGGAKYREGANLEIEINNPALGQVWTRVYGSNPTVGGGTYSICTLTWIVVVLNYTTAGWDGDIGKTVREYLRYILGESAQRQAEERHYKGLPTGTPSISSAARTIVEGIV